MSALKSVQSPWLGGTTPGVLLNVLFPEWLVSTLLVVLLTYTAGPGLDWSHGPYTGLVDLSHGPYTGLVDWSHGPYTGLVEW